MGHDTKFLMGITVIPFVYIFLVEHRVLENTIHTFLQILRPVWQGSQEKCLLLLILYNEGDSII